MVASVLTTHFTHLQVHSHFTLLGGTASVDEIVARAVADGMRYVALTDSHVLYGAVALQTACAKAVVQPILGMTVTVAAPIQTATTNNLLGRLVLIATGREGYRSLCGLSSHIQQGKRPFTIPWQTLKKYRTGLIAIDGGQTGWMAHYLRSNNQKAAVQYASLLGGTFEENGFIGLELQRPSDYQLAPDLITIGERFGLQMAAMQPVYCLQPEERSKLRLLAAIDQNCLLEQVADETLPDGGDSSIDLHWLSPQEMEERFAQFPQALDGVAEIVQRCEPSLPDGLPPRRSRDGSIWPALDLPDGQSAEDALLTLSMNGLHERYGRSPSAEVSQRLQKELAAINQHGFAPLFVVVADIVRFARETAVPVSTRGSVADSLVAYCVGISSVDPIAHDLLFERFLNPARTDLPDIDLDFCSRRRDEVLNYVRHKYGEDRVALVATISTLQPKSALRETAKAYGLPNGRIKQLSKLLPRHWHPDPRRRLDVTLDDLLAQLTDETEKEVMQTAFDLVGQPHHLSVHPGGIVITPTKLTDWVPTQMAPKGFLITQFDHRDVETIGLPKIDLLGIRALTVLADTAVFIQQRHDSEFELAKIGMEDGETAVMLQKGETIGVFQCESSGAQRTLRQLKAKNVRDLAVANAFFKPGPATGGMAAAFVRRYRGEEAVSFLHPTLEPILGKTQGVMLFQEQILRVATEIAGLNWQQANYLRRGISKFKAREMATMRLSFVTGCQKKSEFTSEQAETLWEQVMAFAGYGFNQGHATAYADISYRSAYLKRHWPVEFLCARLAGHGGFHHPAIYIAEARRLGIEVRPPHVNFSSRKFGLGGDELSIAKGQLLMVNDSPPTFWMGLGQVRNLRRRSIRAMIAERERLPFVDLRDLLARVRLQTKEVDHLIKCGGLDGLGESRAAMLAQAAEIGRAGSALQMGFGFGEETAVSPEHLSDRLKWETRLLGFPVSDNPIKLVQSQTADDVPVRLVHRLLNQKTTVAGVRLPGWTGGKGFFFGDGDAFITVKMEKKLKPWIPVRVNGRWRQDEWGGGWFVADQFELLS